MTKVDKRSGTFGRLVVGEVYHADNEKYRGRTLGEVAKHEGKEVYIYMHFARSLRRCAASINSRI
jgi:hypothetical protein